MIIAIMYRFICIIIVLIISIIVIMTIRSLQELYQTAHDFSLFQLVLVIADLSSSVQESRTTIQHTIT